MPSAVLPCEQPVLTRKEETDQRKPPADAGRNDEVLDRRAGRVDLEEAIECFPIYRDRLGGCYGNPRPRRVQSQAAAPKDAPLITASEAFMHTVLRAPDLAEKAHQERKSM